MNLLYLLDLCHCKRNGHTSASALRTLIVCETKWPFEDSPLHCLQCTLREY